MTTTNPPDGGPAFPSGDGKFAGGPTHMNGMTLRDWFATHAPMPTKDEIDMQCNFDGAKNPHNDSYKPPLRERHEIIADLKYRYADAMLKARSALSGGGR